MSRKALKIYPAFIGTCSALAGIVATILTDSTLKCKDEGIDADELADATGSDAKDVMDALCELRDLGFVKSDVDLAGIGTFAPVGLTVNLQERQRALDLTGKAPQGKHDRSIGEDSVVIGGVEYLAVLSPLPPEPGPYTLTIHAEENDERQLKTEMVFNGDGAEAVMEAWRWFDEWVDALKESSDPLYWLRGVPAMDGGMTVKHFLLDDETFNLVKDSEMVLTYEDSLNGQLRTLADLEIGVIVLAVSGEAGNRWPGLTGVKEPEKTDTDGGKKAKKETASV